MVGSRRHQAVDQLLASDLPNVHGARCVLINPIEAKVWFPALSPGHHTLTYGDIDHVDFYGSVTHAASSYDPHTSVDRMTRAWEHHCRPPTKLSHVAAAAAAAAAVSFNREDIEWAK